MPPKRQAGADQGPPMHLRTVLLAAALVLSSGLAPRAEAGAIVVEPTGDRALVQVQILHDGQGWMALILDGARAGREGLLRGAADAEREAAAPRGFALTWHVGQGALTLDFDLDGDGGIGQGETLRRSVFGGRDGRLAGQGFGLVSIAGSGPSLLEDLVIAGTAQEAMKGGMEVFYAPEEGGQFGDLRLTGRLSLAHDGRLDQRVEWLIALGAPAAGAADRLVEVSEPAALAVFGASLLGLAGLLRRRPVAQPAQPV